jgi:hypothetical protein
VAYALYFGVSIADISRGKLPGITAPSPLSDTPSNVPAPAAKWNVKAVMVTGKRIDVAAKWSTPSGPAYLERVTVYFLKDTGEVVREIPFEVGQSLSEYDFTRRFPLEPDAQLFGVCAVYGATKAGVQARLGTLFANKGEGDQSDMPSATAPDDAAQGCFISAG